MLSQDLSNLPNATYEVILSKRKHLIMPDLNDCQFKSTHIYWTLLHYIKDLLTMLWNKIVEAHIKVNYKRPCGHTGIE